MCGINGIAFSNQRRDVDASSLRRMRDVIFHRGPDDGGIFIEKNVGLGHRRLSIVDVSHGAQPMFNEDRSICIVYNGEVYNHADYRAELEADGSHLSNALRYRNDSPSVRRIRREMRGKTARNVRLCRLEPARKRNCLSPATGSASSRFITFTTRKEICFSLRKLKAYWKRAPFKRGNKFQRFARPVGESRNFRRRDFVQRRQASFARSFSALERRANP